MHPRRTKRKRRWGKRIEKNFKTERKNKVGREEVRT